MPSDGEDFQAETKRSFMRGVLTIGGESGDLPEDSSLDCSDREISFRELFDWKAFEQRYHKPKIEARTP